MADCQLCGANHPDGATRCPDQRTGEMIGAKYRIGPLLGVGGIAAVYAAEHPVLRRDVALKILHRRFARDAELAARFVREARETAALGHPAFVRVHDAGTTDDGCAFIEMDRLAGCDLFTLRREHGPLPHERVVHIAIHVLDALTALHGRGVIHRDLKSANIYVESSDGTGEKIKVLDLGFAKVEDELTLTSKDHFVGTPFYISPEQYLDPTAVDARADLFSLGVVMFEALVGEWPYAWSTKRDLLAKVMRGELERHPSARCAEVPDWVDAIVAKALAHARDERFASALDMKQALERGAPPGRPSLLKRLFG
jgi:serine/threonine-protein kinase